ncbi:hypothetical protein [Aquimarina sp. AU119]|uniref:hypothetical protein n=1 Tax=Aquimarina sp. AU119 TaxID=2108528 RepID=UPI000D6960D4|nr:hypothetical protein [Aquimarina sp. AU119]
MESNLIHILKKWDGIHTDYLIACYDHNHHDISFFESLVNITYNNTALQTATTWLIKHHYDHKKELPQHLINELLGNSTQLKNWESKLHILQLLPKVLISTSVINTLDLFVRACIISEKKFVRAWGYQGFYEVTKHIPEYKQELRVLCQNAIQTESASIKSKVRKILMHLDKNECQ